MALVQCAAKVGAELGEAPLWDAAKGCLWWLDITGRRLFGLHPSDGSVTECLLPLRLTALASAQGAELLACGDEGFGFLDPLTGKFRRWVLAANERPGNRFNDGKVDFAGCFWAGTMDDAEIYPTGALHCLYPDGEVSRVAEGFFIPNGPAFDSRGHMYLADSARRTIYRYPQHAYGDPEHRETFASFDDTQGYPDGMTCDVDDHLWVAFWDGWCLRRLSPAGVIVEAIPLPVQRPTSCLFGGAAQDILYVTSASIGLTPDQLMEQPLAGALLAFQPNIPGVAPPIFGQVPQTPRSADPMEGLS